MKTMMTRKMAQKVARKIAQSMAPKMAMTGAGTGVALFAVYGLLPGAFLGGLVGINIAGAIIGMPVEPGTISRVLIASGMLAGVAGVGAGFTFGGAAIGWALGKTVDAIAQWQASRRHAEHNSFSRV